MILVKMICREVSEDVWLSGGWGTVFLMSMSAMLVGSFGGMMLGYVVAGRAFMLALSFWLGTAVMAGLFLPMGIGENGSGRVALLSTWFFLVASEALVALFASGLL